MAGSFYNKNKDSMDISELASLNDDISDDLIEQLQQKLTQNIDTPPEPVPVNVNDDSTLFEEPIPETNNVAEQVTTPNTEADNKTTVEETSNTIEAASTKETDNAPNKEGNQEGKKGSGDFDDSLLSHMQNYLTNSNSGGGFEDNFIKKYRAKLLKKTQDTSSSNESTTASASEKRNKKVGEKNSPDKPIENAAKSSDEPIENLSQGNITERPLTQELKEYNDSLDLLDNNVKYSKYVIYIDPQNVDFIEGLTVKERKNLINGILREQDDIAITKRRFKVIQTVIRHVIISVLTIAISVPVVYYAINASLEATINNHRTAQTLWQSLYKENGKITKH